MGRGEWHRQAMTNRSLTREITRWGSSACWSLYACLHNEQAGRCGLSMGHYERSVMHVSRHQSGPGRGQRATSARVKRHHQNLPLRLGFVPPQKYEERTHGECVYKNAAVKSNIRLHMRNLMSEPFFSNGV